MVQLIVKDHIFSNYLVITFHPTFSATKRRFRIKFMPQLRDRERGGYSWTLTVAPVVSSVLGSMKSLPTKLVVWQLRIASLGTYTHTYTAIGEINSQAITNFPQISPFCNKDSHCKGYMDWSLPSPPLPVECSAPYTFLSGVYCGWWCFLTGSLALVL